jgi:carbamoyltransferase
MRGEIVGCMQGRSELGPRALGNRSILIRPDDTELATRLSKHVK